MRERALRTKFSRLFPPHILPILSHSVQDCRKEKNGPIYREGTNKLTTKYNFSTSHIYLWLLSFDNRKRDSCRVAVPPYLHLRRHDVDGRLAIDDGRAAVEAGEDAETAADGADLGDD